MGYSNQEQLYGKEHDHGSVCLYVCEREDGEKLLQADAGKESVF